MRPWRRRPGIPKKGDKGAELRTWGCIVEGEKQVQKRRRLLLQLCSTSHNLEEKAQGTQEWVTE